MMVAEKYGILGTGLHYILAKMLYIVSLLSLIGDKVRRDSLDVSRELNFIEVFSLGIKMWE